MTNCCGSRWIIYIASEEIADFETIETIELKHAASLDPTNDLQEYVDPIIQILALYTIMELGDHHSSNMGFGANYSPFILDFFFLPISSFNVESVFHNKIQTKYGEKLVIK